MARQHQRKKPGVSLFPFLSILACVIGVLTLMITALALGQMEDDSLADVESLEQAERESESLQQQIAELTAQVAAEQTDAGDLQRLLDERRSERDRLRKKLEQLRSTAMKPEIPQLDRQQWEALIAELEAELNRLQQQIAALEQSLDQRNLPPEEAQVRIEPGGSGVDLDPTFVECAADSIVVLSGEEPQRVLQQDVANHAPFLEILDQIAEQPRASVIFLVRDDGLETYFEARRVARSRYARNGKLPVLGHGKIDLSLFKQ